MIRWRDAALPQLALLTFLTLSLLFAIMNADVSISVAILEYALCMAFFLGVFGSNFSIPGFTPITFMRICSVVITFTSLLSLIGQGFPLRLPYVHFLPDYYYATFGLGGAKVVTLLSFTAIIAESVNKKITGNWNKTYLYLAVLNFLMPSFIIGILCGAVAGAIFFFKRPVAAFFMIVVCFLLVGPYLLNRFDTVSGAFGLVYGSHPKVYQFVMAGQVFQDNPGAIFFGTGLGQYAGQATFWASPTGQLLSSFSIPKLPGMFAPETHLIYAEPIFNTFSNNIWAIRSTSNKPYSTISVLLVELGVPMTLLILAFLIRRFIFIARSIEISAFFLFIFGIMLLDRVHDMPWFGISIIIANGLVRMLSEKPDYASLRTRARSSLSG